MVVSLEVGLTLSSQDFHACLNVFSMALAALQCFSIIGTVV
jgi:hypothetical protein